MMNEQPLLFESEYGGFCIEGDTPFGYSIQCTFETEEIRDEFQRLLKVKKTPFPLPDQYTIEILPSEFWGEVAKIVFKEL